MATIFTWFQLGTLGMLLGTIVLAVGTYWVPPERRRRYALVVSIPAIAAVAYGLMALDLGAVSGGGNTVYVPRYVDWLLTTPITLVYIGLLAGVGTRMLGYLAGLQAATILLGMIGAIAGFPWNLILFIAGSATFAGVIYLVYDPVQASAVATLSDVGVGHYRTLRNFVIVLWLIYPFIWLATPATLGLMDLETASLVITYLDIVAKVGFGLFALYALVLTAENRSAASPDDSGAAGEPSAENDRTTEDLDTAVDVEGSTDASERSTGEPAE